MSAALGNNDSDALVNSGRRSPPTIVRDVSPSREHSVPIHLTGQPANITYRSSPATTAEKQPFLPASYRAPGETYGSDTENDLPHSTTGQKEKLTLIKPSDSRMATEPEGSGWRAKLSQYTRVNNVYIREFLAEFLGSFILIIFGNGAVAEVVLSKKPPHNMPINNFFSINVGYGLGVAFGVYVAGGISGGHLNPAVTLGMAVLGKLKWIKVPIYMLAQLLGCFVASAILYAIYYDAINDFDGGYRITNPAHPNATAGIFASYPQGYLSWSNGLVDQIFATSFLVIGILALTDDRNMAPHKGVVPILVGLLVTAIGLSYGYNCGYPINPARDLGPRIFTAMAGWGVEPFSFRDHNWFWVPIIGPLLGGLLGVAIYQMFIGNQWPPLQRSGIELQVVRKNQVPEEYELVKAAHVRPGDNTIPVSLTTKDGQQYR